MRKKIVVIIVFLMFFSISYCQLDSGYGTPFSVPRTPSIYSFEKYGEFESNEYRGLVSVGIPIYGSKTDEVNLDLNLSYYTGGIKVSDEAGIVGLGWDMNIPTIIQHIKDKDDFESGIEFKKLPPYVGNTFYVNRGALHPNVSQYSQFGMPSYSTAINYLDEPSYFVSSYDFLIDGNGSNYVGLTNGYNKLISSYTFDSELDIFKINLEGIELVFARASESQSISIQHLSDFIGTKTFKVLNGRDDFKVELVNSLPYDISDGIKITSPKGNQYYFEEINEIKISVGYGGFLQSGGGFEKTQNKIFNLTKVITAKNKIISLNYTTTTVNEIKKVTENYYKRVGNTFANTTQPLGYFDMAANNFSAIPTLFISAYSDGLSYFVQDGPSVGISSTSTNSTQNYKLLTSIQTPTEDISFNYSNRIDYSGMKKLDNITVFNKNNFLITNVNFNYSYFESNSCNNCYSVGSINSNFLKKRLKLDSVSINDKVYRFEYDEIQLPHKNSFSIDYWGYYNGAPNTSFNPSIEALGYGNYLGNNFTDNNQNNFNPNITYAKAGTLKKMYYPTGGYTEFEFELHEFDNYISDVTNYYPVINNGFGLRIKKIYNYDKSGVLSTSKRYKYYGGKCIFKKRLARSYSMNVIRRNDNQCNVFSSLVIETGLSNFLSNSTTGTEDYIGYDKVEISDSFEGTVEKNFVNNAYSIYNSPSTKMFNPFYFQKRDYTPNGTLLNQKIYDNNNLLLRNTDYLYFKKTSNEKRYSVNVNFYDYYYHYIAFSDYYEIISIPNFLLSFYPVFSNSVNLVAETTTDYFSTGSKKTYTSYPHIGTIPTGKIISDNNDSFSETVSLHISPTAISKNIRNLTNGYTIIEGSNTTKSYHYYYQDINNTLLVSRIEEIYPTTYPPKIKNLYHDLYDSNCNLLQYHYENGIYVATIWGYNKTLPVAKIENIEYNSISQNLISAIQTATDLPIINNDEVTHRNNVLDKLNLLRQALSSTPTQITTYTYIPLVGVTSITDSKGDKLTYEYDEFNKLKRITDKDGKIIEEYLYHYKN